FLFDDDSFEGITLTRRVIYSVSGEYLVVVDHVNSREACTGVQRWQLGPSVETSFDRHRVELTNGDHRAALCFSGTRTELESVTGREDPFDGWVSTGWKKKEPATAVLARKSGTKFRFITTLAAGRGVHPSVTMHRANEPGQFCLEVDTGRARELILVGRESVSFPDSTPMHGLPPAATRATTQGRRTKTGRPHHLDRTSRTEVFDLLESARELRPDTAVERRVEIAEHLQVEAQARGLNEGIDLGI